MLLDKQIAHLDHLDHLVHLRNLDRLQAACLQTFSKVRFRTLLSESLRFTFDSIPQHLFDIHFVLGF